MPDAVRIVLLLLILLGNALFVSAEYSLVTARRSHLTELAERGSHRARVALELTQHPLRFVSTVQVGVTLFSILFGAVGAPLLEDYLAPPLATGLAFLVAFVILTYLHVLLGELIPKAISLSRKEELALALALPLRAFSLAFSPLVAVLDVSVTGLARAFGIRPAPLGVAVETEEDIRLLVAHAEEAGVIEEAEEEMLYKVFEFAEKEARDVMVPRPAVDALPVDLSAGECLATVSETRHTRYPVYRETLDDVVGILNVHDLLSATRERGVAEVRLEDLVRPAYVVPETKDLGALLIELRRGNQQMAIVTDEYNLVQGIATLEDLLEEIVGEIADEYDFPDESVVRSGERSVVIHGTFPIDDFNERFGLELPPEDYRTLAGFVFGRLGRAPKPGDEVRWNGLRFEVLMVEGMRIELLDVEFATPLAGAEPFD